MAGRSISAQRLLEYLTDVYLGLMLLVFLAYTGPGGYLTITEDKFHLLLGLTGGYAAASLLLVLELWIVEERRPASPHTFLKQVSPPQFFILLYLLWTVLSTLCSVAPATSLWGTQRREGLVSIAMYCVAFLLVSFFGRPKKLHLWLFAAGVTFCCGVAVIQLLGYNPLLLFPEGMSYYKRSGYAGSFLGTVGNIDLLSAVLCVAIPVLWVAVLRLKGRWKYALLLPLALSLGVLCLSYVEAGLVGVFGGALLTIPVVAPGDDRHRKRLALGAGALILLTTAAIYFFGADMPGFLSEVHQLLHGHWDDDFGSGRLHIWRNVLPLIPERPLLGGGPDTLGIRGGVYFERYSTQLNILLRSVADAAHNEYLNVAINQGLPALLFYMTALLSAAVFWVKQSPQNTAAAICGAGVLGYCIQAFFGLSSIVSAPFFWLVLALLTSEMGRKNPHPVEIVAFPNSKMADVGISSPGNVLSD